MYSQRTWPKPSETATCASCWLNIPTSIQPCGRGPPLCWHSGRPATAPSRANAWPKRWRSTRADVSPMATWAYGTGNRRRRCADLPSSSAAPASHPEYNLPIPAGAAPCAGPGWWSWIRDPLFPVANFQPLRRPLLWQPYEPHGIRIRNRGTGPRGLAFNKPLFFRISAFDGRPAAGTCQIPCSSFPN